MPDDDDNHDPAAAADDPIVELSQSKLNAMMADARRKGRGERSSGATPTISTPAPMDANSIAAIVAATVNAMRPPEPARPPPAAAPAAPTAHSLPSNNGLIDPFAPGAAAHLGPRGVRKALEAAWTAHSEAIGAPVRPKPPTR